MLRSCIFFWVALMASQASAQSAASAPLTQSAAAAESPTPTKPPQTARQALIEMFLGKDPDHFKKHLPKLAIDAMVSEGETPQDSILQRISMLSQQISANEHVETFDDGPTIVSSESGQGNEKIRLEAVVEHDSFSGDTDEIEVSIHSYRDGKPQFLIALPRLTFSLIQENEIWKLSDLTVTAQVPLTDAEYLKGVRGKVNETNERMASAHVGMLASLEATYATQNPGRGYSCDPSDLSPKAPTPGPTPGASSGIGTESAGYHYEFSGCSGNPVTKFQIVATPIDHEAGMKTFCANESGTVRSDGNGDLGECLSHGEPLDQPANTDQDTQ